MVAVFSLELRFGSCSLEHDIIQTIVYENVLSLKDESKESFKNLEG
jgi:hypothetical protein